MKKRRMFILLAIAIAGISLIVVYLLFAKSVILAWYEAGDPIGKPIFVVLNPLRDKGPELAADYVLRRFKNGECSEALIGLGLTGLNYDQLCDKFSSDLPGEWELLDRDDQKGAAILFYRITSSADPSYIRNLWIDVAETKSGWVVTNVRAFL